MSVNKFYIDMDKDAINQWCEYFVKNKNEDLRYDSETGLMIYRSFVLLKKSDLELELSSTVHVEGAKSATAGFYLDILPKPEGGCKVVINNPSNIEEERELIQWLFSAVNKNKIENNSAIPSGENEQADAQDENELLEGEPWMQIPDHLWDRKAVKLWLYGHSQKEIAESIGEDLKEATVNNRICQLRRDFPSIVIYEAERKRRRMKIP